MVADYTAQMTLTPYIIALSLLEKFLYPHLSEIKKENDWALSNTPRYQQRKRCIADIFLRNNYNSLDF